MAKVVKTETKDKADNLNISQVEQYIIDRVKEMRVAKGLSQRDISYMMDVSQNFIAQVENPTRREKYNINHVYLLAEILKCEIMDILPPQPKRK